MSKIVALVKFNSSVALVLDEPVKLNYKRYGDLIIGVDDTETFIRCYYSYESTREASFGCYVITVNTVDGEEIKCNSITIDGSITEAAELIGKELSACAVGNNTSLKKRYIFTGMYAIKDKLEEVVSSYKGKVYEYYEYEEELRRG